MREFFRRLFYCKPLAAEIIGASFFVNILFLASPIFVIQILSRYIGYGFDGTLFTLTGGMLIALVLTYGFTAIRTRMALAINAGPDRELMDNVLHTLTKVRAGHMLRMPQARIQQVVATPQIIQGAFEPTRFNSVLDLPFFLLFFLAILAISPLLSVITLLAVIATVVSGLYAARSAAKLDATFRETVSTHRGGVFSAVTGVDMIRSFLSGDHLRKVWSGQQDSLGGMRDKITREKSNGMAILQTVSSLLKVAVYAVGAKLCVDGELTVGALIGVSILAAKALQIASSFVQTMLLQAKAEEGLAMLKEFFEMPLEAESGVSPSEFKGRIDFNDVCFEYPSGVGPLFESLNLPVEPGAVVGITGFNGAGKSTLVRLLMGLEEPTRGQILVDGVDLRQVAPDWWRKQVVYLPQEPLFFNGTFKDNLLTMQPELDEEELAKIIKIAGLSQFLDTSREGLDSPVADGGKRLPVGIRKRLGLARALTSGGSMIIFDEPTEGLDEQGCAAVYEVLNTFVQRGATMFVVSRDPRIVKGFSMVVDLSTKPTPRIGVRQPNEEQAKEAGGLS